MQIFFSFSGVIFSPPLAHIQWDGVAVSFGAAQQFCLTRVGQELSFCRASWIKVGGGAAPPICLSLQWSGGATGCPRFDDGEGVTHAAWVAADKDAAWQDKEREAADSGEQRRRIRAEAAAVAASRGEKRAYGIRAPPLAAALISFSPS